MPYLRIPKSKIPGAIAKLVSKLELELTTRIQQEAGKIVDKIRSEGCPTNLNRTVRKAQGLTTGINKLESRLKQFKALPKIILIPIKALEAIAKVILSLPVPQSPSPVPGLPISVTNKLTELIIITFEFIAQKKEDAEAGEDVIKESKVDTNNEADASEEPQEGSPEENNEEDK